MTGESIPYEVAYNIITLRESKTVMAKDKMMAVEKVCRILWRENPVIDLGSDGKVSLQEYVDYNEFLNAVVNHKLTRVFPLTNQQQELTFKEFVEKK